MGHLLAEGLGCLVMAVSIVLLVFYVVEVFRRVRQARRYGSKQR